MSDLKPQPTPAELLRDNVVLNVSQAAIVLGLLTTRGKSKGSPDTGRVRQMVADGKLRLIDASQPPSRWCFSVSDIKRFIDPPTGS